MSNYRVKSPAVGVKVGGKIGIFYAGGIVAGGDAEDVERLVREGHLVPLESKSAPEGQGQAPQGDVKPPAKSGPGSGAAAWRDYAESVGVSVDESSEREATIKAIAAAGKPTE